MAVLPVWLQSASDFLWRDLLFKTLPEVKPKTGQRTQIDLGNGRVLGAEDVLEGHYRRMSRLRQPATRQVVVQVGDNLTAAIAVLAPDLVPYTQIAEEVSSAVPPVEPERHFRENLHEALERTHRQHAAQRLLGMRAAPRAKAANPFRWWIALAGVVATLALLWNWRSRQGTAPAG